VRVAGGPAGVERRAKDGGACDGVPVPPNRLPYSEPVGAGGACTSGRCAAASDTSSAAQRQSIEERILRKGLPM